VHHRTATGAAAEGASSHDVTLGRLDYVSITQSQTCATITDYVTVTSDSMDVRCLRPRLTRRTVLSRVNLHV